MLHVGIDEAGYGPNLGPLVMAAVIVESEDGRPPDVWGDLPNAVGRANSGADRFWVDDSKAIYSGGKGRERLEATALAVVETAVGKATSRLSEWLAATGAGSLADVELGPWLAPGEDPPVPLPGAAAMLARYRASRPLDGAPWRIVAARAEVVGPSRFNEGIIRGESKAAPHFDAFARLVRPIWEGLADGESASVRGDKHGGRHFYLGPLSSAFADVWIERGEEGPALSRYVLSDPRRSRRLELSLLPRADSEDGLVALASILAKALREAWMAAFNAYWSARIEGLRPTAGYPGDAARFRAAIEPLCAERGLEPSRWWRER